MGAAAVFETAAETPPTRARRKENVSFADFNNELSSPSKAEMPGLIQLRRGNVLKKSTRKVYA